MKTGLWVIVTLLTWIVGLLVGFSASSRLQVSRAGAGGQATGTSGYAAPAPGGAAGYGGAGAHGAGGAAGYGGVGAAAGGAGGYGGQAAGPSKSSASKAQEAAVKTSGY